MSAEGMKNETFVCCACVYTQY